MRAYLDWAATAPPHPVAKEAAIAAMETLGNPSSVHGEGRAARDLLETARAQVASLVGCAAREVIFTSSGTEANTLGVVGGFHAGGASSRVAYAAVEHPSVLLAAQSLGVEEVILPSLPSGAVDLAAAQERLVGGARVVAVQLANNETGVVQPIRSIAGLAASAGARLHCDAVQALGKIPIAEAYERSHTLALSAHKIGGLAGAGALVVKQGAEPHAVLPGHQEGGIRGGTHSLVAIAAFGAVAAHVASAFEARAETLKRATAALERTLLAASPEARILGVEEARVPGIVDVTFPGVDGETLLVSLDLAGVACAHGAACSTGAMEVSHVLRAMGLSPREARATLRFSVGDATTEAELQHLASVLPAALHASQLPSREAR